MSDYGFVYPQLLWLFALLLPLVVIWSFLQRRRESVMTRFMVRENWPLLNRTISSRARFHKGLLVLLALSFSIVAAARPYWGIREQEVKSRGVNIFFAIDVSNSMRARDVGTGAGFQRGAPNDRLNYAKSIMRQMLLELPGHRAGIIPFAGDAFVQTPLTTDYSMVQGMLPRIDYDAISYPGTNFSEMIRVATEAFEASGDGNRVLVVLTDGEDHSEAIDAAARQAAEKNIRIFALGIGSLDGAPVIMPDNTYKEDTTGSKVLSRLDPEILRTLAERTGGRAYVASSGGQLDPRPVISDINRLEREEFGEEKRVFRQERYQWPLALGLLCLLAEGVIRDRKREGKKVVAR